MFNCLLALQKCKSLCNHKLLNTLQFFYDTTKRGGVDNQSEEFCLSGNDKIKKRKKGKLSNNNKFCKQEHAKRSIILWCVIENHQDPFYVVNWYFSRRPDRC